jgi:hypothetical protein
MKQITLSLSLFLTFITTLIPRAHAFPEMIRHGYANCNTCHISQNGAGSLSDYGRELSKETLAMWSSSDTNSKEHHSLYGALDDTEFQKYIKVSGDVRGAYVYRDDPFVQEGKSLFMQGDLEVAFQKGPFTLLGSLGFEKEGEELELVARKHYLSYNFSDPWSLRIGKFIPAYGINTADHVTFTRSGLRMGPNFESYNLETSYIKDDYSVFLTGILGRPDDTELNRDHGLALQGSYNLTTKSTIGFEGYLGKNDTTTRGLIGPFALIGFGPHDEFALQSEIDLQFKKDDKAGIFTTNKLSYEIRSGLWAFLTQEYTQTQFGNSQSGAQVYGLGLQVFPRAHFEVNIFFAKEKINSFSSQFYDYGWVVGHFYL